MTMTTLKKHRILLIQLQPLAKALILGTLHGRNDCNIVGSLSTTGSPAGQHEDRNACAGIELPEFSSFDEAPPADVAFVGDTAGDTEHLITMLAHQHVNVVTVLDGLGNQIFNDSEKTARIHQTFRDNGVSILPVADCGSLLGMLKGLPEDFTRSLSRAEVRLSADLTEHELDLAALGIGLSRVDFHSRQDTIGVLFRNEIERWIASVADAIGWQLDEVVVERPDIAVITDTARSGRHTTAEPGTTTAVRHGAVGLKLGVPVIEASVHYGLFEAFDPIDKADALSLKGAERNLRFTVQDGFRSFFSQVVTACENLGTLAGLPPGLVTQSNVLNDAMLSKRQPSVGVSPTRPLQKSEGKNKMRATTGHSSTTIQAQTGGPVEAPFQKRCAGQKLEGSAACERCSQWEPLNADRTSVQIARTRPNET
jgi:hypothetical protein